jgi:hypothetical protein
VWVAERMEAGASLGRSRVDEFQVAATEGFLAPQRGEEGNLSELDNGVAVGRPGGEEEVYVGAGKEGKYVVAVFGPAGRLIGTWDGGSTALKAFAPIRGVAVDTSSNLETHGDVYVATTTGVDVFAGEAGGGEPKLVGELTGPAPSRFFQEVNGIAVSPVNGDVVVVDGSPAVCGAKEECMVDVFEPVAGVPGAYGLRTSIRGVASAKGGAAKPFQRIGPVAVAGESDPRGIGDIYVLEGEEQVVDQFNEAGEYVGRITGTPAQAFGSLRSVAVEAGLGQSDSGDLLLGDFDPLLKKGAVDVFGPTVVVPNVSTGPVKGVTVTGLGEVSATLSGTVDPLEAETGEGASCQFSWGPSESAVSKTACGAAVVGNGNVPVAVTINGLATDTRYFYHLEAFNKSGASQGEEASECEGRVGLEACFTTPGPGIHGEDAQNVAATSATLGATIDPNGASTSYYFQYGASTEYGSDAPAAPGTSLGSGMGDVQVIPQHIQHLSPGTLYHYRVVAVSMLEVEGVKRPVSFYGPDHTFATQNGASSGGTLTDERRWELVSPPDKHGALILPIRAEGVIQAAASGAGVTYFATLPTEESVKGYIYNGVQVLAARGASGGWVSQDVSLPHSAPTGVPEGHGNEYRAFSTDLSTALVEPLGEFTSLAPEVFPPDTE